MPGYMELSGRYVGWTSCIGVSPPFVVVVSGARDIIDEVIVFFALGGSIRAPRGRLLLATPRAHTLPVNRAWPSSATSFDGDPFSGASLGASGGGRVVSSSEELARPAGSLDC